jgi:hypothetical protein
MTIRALIELSLRALRCGTERFGRPGALIELSLRALRCGTERFGRPGALIAAP